MEALLPFTSGVIKPDEQKSKPPCRGVDRLVKPACGAVPMMSVFLGIEFNWTQVPCVLPGVA